MNEKLFFYVIFNRVAKEPVSQPFVCSNDVEASYSFIGFLNKTVKTDLGMKDTIFELRRIGCYFPLETKISDERTDLLARGRDEAMNVISNVQDTLDTED